MSDFDLLQFGKELQSEWESLPKEEEKASFDEPIPDGTYKAKIKELKISTYNQKPRLVWTFEIVSGKFRDRYIWKNQILSPRALSFIRKDFAKIGFKIDNFMEEIIQGACFEEQLGKTVEIKQVQNGEWKNIWIQKRIFEFQSEKEAIEEDLPF